MTETIRARLMAEGTQFKKEFAAAEMRVGKLSSSLKSLGGVVAGALSLRAGIRMFNDMRNEIDAIGKASDRLRMPAEEVQRLSMAAQMADSDVDSLVARLGRAQVAAADAARGNTALQEVFQRLGLSASEFAGMKPEAQLAALADAYANASDRGAVFSDLTKVLGRGVTDLIPLLKGGAAGIDEIGRSTRVLAEEDIRNIEAMNDAWTLATTNMKVAVMQGLMPALQELATWVKETDFDGWAMRSKVAAETVAESAGIVKGIVGAPFKAGAWVGRQVAGLIGDDEPERQQVASAATMENRRKEWAEKQAQADTASAAAVEVREKSEAEITAEMREQAKLAQEMQRAAEDTARLREKVGRKIFEEQTAETRRDAARQDMAGLLATAGVGSLDELRQAVGRAETEEEQRRLLEFLERGLEIRDDIREANEDIARAASDAAREEERAAAAAESAAKLKSDAARAAAELAASQATAKADFAAETEALRLELQGRKDLADALREEVAMRAESVRMAEAMGISEAEALGLLREQARLRRQISEQETRRPGGRSTIRGRVDGVQGASGVEGAMGGLSRRPGLREDILRRRGDARMRESAGRENAARFWERQLDLQEQLVKKFSMLGAV
jgi:hypothetical protein